VAAVVDQVAVAVAVNVADQDQVYVQDSELRELRATGGCCLGCAEIEKARG
jgi:hypothetical protein